MVQFLNYIITEEIIYFLVKIFFIIEDCENSLKNNVFSEFIYLFFIQKVFINKKNLNRFAFSCAGNINSMIFSYS